MPLLSIDTNVAIDGDQARALIHTASAEVASRLGKPERYVMIRLTHQPHMLFAGDDAPLAYLELKSIGLPEERTQALSQALCDLVSSALSIASDRIYIEFANAPRHLWGFDGGTF